MKRLRALGNPHTWLAICLTIILLTGAWVVAGELRLRAEEAQNTREALSALRATERNQQDERAKTNAQIAELERRIDALTRELVAEEKAGSAQAAYTARQIQILKDQVRRLNGRPIIINPPTSTTTTTRPRTTVTDPSTTSTTRKPTTTTTRCRRVIC